MSIKPKTEGLLTFRAAENIPFFLDDVKQETIKPTVLTSKKHTDKLQRTTHAGINLFWVFEKKLYKKENVAFSDFTRSHILLSLFQSRQTILYLVSKIGRSKWN